MRYARRRQLRMARGVRWLRRASQPLSRRDAHGRADTAPQEWFRRGLLCDVLHFEDMRWVGAAEQHGAEARVCFAEQRYAEGLYNPNGIVSAQRERGRHEYCWYDSNSTYRTWKDSCSMKNCSCDAMNKLSLGLEDHAMCWNRGPPHNRTLRLPNRTHWWNLTGA